MKFGKKFFVKLMSLIKKGAISSFVQSGNFEIFTLTGFEPATLRVAVGHLNQFFMKFSEMYRKVHNLNFLL